MNSNKETLKKLNSLFGSYRAEWLKGKIFELFAEPSYFTALQDNRPCVLEGGRGTGKTTVLRGLSFQGQFALHQKDIIAFDKIDFIGIYHRVNTNHVRAFIGGGISIESWKKLFSHYFNLIVCKEILTFLKWHSELMSSDEKLTKHVCSLMAKSLNIYENCEGQDQLLELLEVSLVEFQSKVNNINDGELPNMSMAGDPIKIITEHIIELRQFDNKMFFIILDEYENFEDYQQQIVNTLIKHNTEYYTFKIGVRELGWRVKHTLNPDELLHDPSDYVLIEIEQKLSESYFSDFAKHVCEQRIKLLWPLNINVQDYFIERALGNLTIEEEAILLDVEKTTYFKKISSINHEYQNMIKDIPYLYQYFILYWAYWHKMAIEKAIDDYFQNRENWNTRYENYKYEMLFKIRKGRGKSGIQKYYSGWNTYIKLAKGNIRYLMELVYRAYEKHLNTDADLTTQVDFKNQTIAAQEVGQKNLMELEGLWKNGAQLTKLLLGFGRVFQVLSSEEGNSSPEKNQFSIENSESLSSECQEIITAAVMNLALVRSPGNKLTETTTTRDYLYTIHPIYSAFFVFSYRRKRKIIIKQDDILGIISKPKETISKILKHCNITEDIDNNLPTQLKIFEDYYNG
jgi:hypothetical protein